MPYKLLKIEKVIFAEGTSYVANIQQEGVEQPFKMTLEHFESEQEVKDQVKAWIEAREVEDASREKEAQENQETSLKDGIVNSINSNPV